MLLLNISGTSGSFLALLLRGRIHTLGWWHGHILVGWSHSDNQHTKNDSSSTLFKFAFSLFFQISISSLFFK